MAFGMKAAPTAIAAALAMAGATMLAPVSAAASSAELEGAAPNELAAYLQCVPFARERTGIAIFGDAHSWWTQAAGRFRRGRVPEPGAMMAFRPHRTMQLGHVAAVTRVIDSRTVLLSHANWSPIDGRRGQIEHNVKAVDVSPDNDWSAVRVWYHPLQALGKTAWPVHGFIYRDDAGGSAKPSNRFAQAFASMHGRRAAR